MTLDAKTISEPARQQMLNKTRGLVVGGALGDTIGLYTEFLKKQTAKEAYPSKAFSLVEPVTPLYDDNHRNRFETRAWTDDTDQSLLLLLSYLHNNGTLTPADFALRLRSWCRQGLRCLDRLPLGIGRTVGTVVTADTFQTDPIQTAHDFWTRTNYCNAANGSVMRTSIIAAMVVFDDLQKLFVLTDDVGRVTHADPRCRVSCCAVVGLAWGLLRGEITNTKQVDEMLERAWHFIAVERDCGSRIVDAESGEVRYEMDREEWVQHVYPNSKKGLSGMVLDDVKMGYTYLCLGSSLWCLRAVLDRTETFESAMVELVMAGGDADTNGAVAGALMGCVVGYDALPPQWRDGLRHRDWLLSKVDAMCILNGLQNTGMYDPAQDRDTDLDGGRGFLSEEDMKKREMELMEVILMKGQARREVRDKKKKGSLWAKIGKQIGL